MKEFRIFVKDRGRLYSGYCKARGETAAQALRLERMADSWADRLYHDGKLKCIAWPPDARGQAWLDKFVNKAEAA